SPISHITASSKLVQSSLQPGRYATRPCPNSLNNFPLGAGPSERESAFCARTRRHGSQRPVASVTIIPPPFRAYCSKLEAKSPERYSEPATKNVSKTSAPTAHAGLPRRTKLTSRANASVTVRTLNKIHSC